MNLMVTILVSVGIVHVVSSSDVEDLITEIRAILPKDDMIAVFLNYNENDEEVKNYVQLAKNTESTLNSDKMLESLQTFIGIDVTSYYNELIKFVQTDLEDYTNATPPLKHGQKTGTGVKGLLNDVLAVMPHKKILKIVTKKAETSSEVKKIAMIITAMMKKQMKMKKDSVHTEL